MLEVITDLRKRGIGAVPRVIPLGFLKKQEDGSMKSEISINGIEVLPLGGIANRVTVLCNEGGEYTIYESDEHGFHNATGIWKYDHIDIVALGDSFTHGFCVPSDKNFVALIRKRYPATLNLGNAGEGPLLMLAALREYLPFIKPKVVLWFYFEENDLLELKQEKESRLLMRYLENDFNQGLLASQSDIDQSLTHYVERATEISRLREKSENNSKIIINKLLNIIKLSTLRKRLGLIYGKYNRIQQDETYDLTEREIDLFRNILLLAKTSVSAWGGILYFVYLPAWERYGNPDIAGRYHRDQVLTVVRTLGIPVIDVHLAFQSQNDPLSLFPFRRFGHYNEEGHRVVAEEVLRNISLDREIARSEVNN
jgi:hypothetical protein